MAVRLFYQDAQIILCFFVSVFSLIMGYKIYSVEDAGVCNQTIWLGEGSESAAILRLTERDFYSFDNLYCYVIFKAPMHSWSGLTGVLEEVDMRRYEDPTRHHLGQNFCVDYIMVHSNKSSSPPQQEQCGAWAVVPGQPLTELGYRRALVGFCPRPRSSSIKCDGMSTLMVEVSVGLQKNGYLWREQPWRPHRGFTFVVTAYSYSSVSGHCLSNLWSCGGTDSGMTSAAAAATAPAGSGHHHHCIHESLWCDGHVNCGMLENWDELSCRYEDQWGGLVTMVAGPWLGAVLFLLLVLGIVVYWWRARPRGPPEGQQGAPPEFNSYTESYELSSNVSSAHHMAIQVRVLCNAGHTRHNVRATPASATAAWQTDLPPAYDALFPRGPPEPYSFASTTTTTNVSTAVVSFASSSTSKTASIPSSSSMATVVSTTAAGGAAAGPKGVAGSSSVATNLETLTGQMALSVASIQTISCGHPSGFGVPTPSAGAATTPERGSSEMTAAASVTTTVTCSATYPDAVAEEGQGPVPKDATQKGSQDAEAAAAAGQSSPASVIVVTGGANLDSAAAITTATSTVASTSGTPKKPPPPPPPPRKDRSPNRLGRASPYAPPSVVEEGVRGPNPVMASSVTSLSEGGRPLTLGLLPSPSNRSLRDDTASFSSEATATTTLPSASTPPSPAREGGGGGEMEEEVERGVSIV